MILKLKRTPGIFLVGFMACGKTTVGRLLATELGWSFVDLDDDIVARAGCSINEIFDTRGEAEFRRIEHDAVTAAVQRVKLGLPTVVALGGGAFAQEANFRLVSDNGVSIWLDCPIEVLAVRVADSSERPLARDPVRFARLFEERQGFYARAEYRIAAGDDDPRRILCQILDLPIF